MRSKVELLEYARYIMLAHLKKTEVLLENTISLRRREELKEECEILNLIDEMLLEELREELR